MAEPHEILGVDRHATEGEIKTAFKTLAQIYHPDRYTSASARVQAESARRMKEISAAYQTMMSSLPKDVTFRTKEWTVQRKGDLTEALLAAGIPHSWRGDEVTVAHRHREQAKALVFRKPESGDQVEYITDHWTNEERANLTFTLLEAEIPHEWVGPNLTVPRQFEPQVDPLVGY